MALQGSAVRKILCAIDFSERSFRALEKAVELASESNAELHLVHVVPVRHHLEEYEAVACSLLEHIEARRILDSYLKLTAIVEQRIPKNIKTRLSIRHGDPALEIVHRATSEDADLIILGKEESRGWRRFISHTVTDKVMRQASCPVLAIQSAHH